MKGGVAKFFCFSAAYKLYNILRSITVDLFHPKQAKEFSVEIGNRLISIKIYR